MTAKADSRLPAPLTPGPRAGKFVGFCHGVGACSLLCLALELGEGQSVLCFLVLQFTELISRESRGEATPEAFSSQSDLHLTTKRCSAVTMSKGSTSKDPT